MFQKSIQHTKTLIIKTITTHKYHDITINIKMYFLF